MDADTTERADDGVLGPVARAFRVVKAVAESPRAPTGKEIADTLGLPPSSVHRLLQLLVRIQIVGRAGTRQEYGPGPELQRIAFAVARNTDVGSTVRDQIQALVRELNTTAVFWHYDRSAKLLVASEVQYSTHLIDFREAAFAPRSLLWGAQGRAVLAYLPEAEIQYLIKMTSATSPTGYKFEGEEALLRELAAIRERGYARSQGHSIADAIGFAAPVFGQGGTVVGCVGVPMPISRFRESDTPRLSRAVVQTAQTLTAQVGEAISFALRQ